MTFDLLPYLLLMLAIVLGAFSARRLSMALLGVAVLAGVFTGRLVPASVIWIAALGLSLWLPHTYKLPKVTRWLSVSLFLFLSIAMLNHLVPGFLNLPIYKSLQFSPDSIPFTMYLNFDKPLVGFFVLLFWLKLRVQEFSRTHVYETTKILSMLILTMLPLAVGIGYVRWDLKFPDLSWIWMLNNLFFVCFAEEGFFRGFIQKGVAELLPKSLSILAIFVAALLFGLAHYKGGWAYIGLSTFAGLFYGYAFHKTGRLEAAILVHFGLNVVHFLFFSYPALG